MIKLLPKRVYNIRKERNVTHMNYEAYIYRMTQLLKISVKHAEEVYFIYFCHKELDRLEDVLQGLENV